MSEASAWKAGPAQLTFAHVPFAGALPPFSIPNDVFHHGRMQMDAVQWSFLCTHQSKRALQHTSLVFNADHSSAKQAPAPGAKEDGGRLVALAKVVSAAGSQHMRHAAAVSSQSVACLEQVDRFDTVLYQALIPSFLDDLAEDSFRAKVVVAPKVVGDDNFKVVHSRSTSMIPAVLVFFGATGHEQAVTMSGTVSKGHD